MFDQIQRLHGSSSPYNAVLCGKNNYHYLIVLSRVQITREPKTNTCVIGQLVILYRKKNFLIKRLRALHSSACFVFPSSLDKRMRNVYEQSN